ncbi:MAG: GDP-mannose 4,6-dehydratase [Fervidicoccaceae archaeon]|nr:GDP-mannose 4,6-dehydratase [Fervidicoccaceae archaeon]
MPCIEIDEKLYARAPRARRTISDEEKELVTLEELEEKNVLIFGGAGFLGSWLTEALLEMGAHVTVVDNLSTGSLKNIEHLLPHKNMEFIKQDIRAFTGSNKHYDYVVNMAARPSPEDYATHPVDTLLTSAEGSRNALEIARKNDAVYIFTSTSEVYGNPHVIPTPEDYWGYVNPIGPRSCYDEGKRFAEALTMAYHREYGLDVRISRIFNTYGPRLDISMPSYGRVITKFITQALRGEPITVHGDGKQTRSFLYVTDNIEAHLLLMTKKEAKGQVINIGSDQEIEIIRLAELIKELTHSTSPIVFLPPRPDDPPRRRPDISKAKRLLGWEPRTPLREGLQKTIEWFRRTTIT